jgi:hypothetical protein
MREITPKLADQSGGAFPFSFRNPKLTTREMNRTADVVCVEVSKNYLSNISWRNSQGSKLRTDLFIGMY